MAKIVTEITHSSTYVEPVVKVQLWIRCLKKVRDAFEYGLFGTHRVVWDFRNFENLGLQGKLEYLYSRVCGWAIDRGENVLHWRSPWTFLWKAFNEHSWDGRRRIHRIVAWVSLGQWMENNLTSVDRKPEKWQTMHRVDKVENKITK